MIFLLSVLCYSRKVITFPELQNRTPQEVCRNYFDNLVWTKKEECYIPGENCTYGTQSEDDIVHACKRVNFYRTFVGLNALNRSYDKYLLKLVQEASLCLEKSDQLTHEIRPEFKCYSNEAFLGARQSNIAGGGCSTTSITSFMSDHGNPLLGHRRYILNPYLNKIVTASTTERASLLVYYYSVLDDHVQNPPKLIAYPPPGPVPYDLIFWAWQFSKEFDNQNDNNNLMPKDTRVELVCDNEKINIEQEVLGKIATKTPGLVKWKLPFDYKVLTGTNCKVSIISDSLDTEWKYTVSAIDCNKVDMSVKSKKKGLSKGGKIAIAVVVILAAAAIGIGIFIFIKKRRNTDNSSIFSSFF